jgi:hypothetical protein
MAENIKKKKAVSGFIEPRWPKERVVKWLEIGAVPAIVGLWFPDWLGSFGRGEVPFIPPLLPILPPLLSYGGALILLKACYEGIKNMGFHFKGLLISGTVCVLSAVISIVLVFTGQSLLSLLLTGSAAFFAAGFFWFTIGKVYEITQEKRTRITWHFVWVLSVLALAVYAAGWFLLFRQSPAGIGSTVPAGPDVPGAFFLIRIGVAVITLAFFFCRYGVYCYKTQTSIGARFAISPDDQYWIGAEK